MSLADYMLKLGLALSGTNADLAFLAPESKGAGDDAGDDDTDPCPDCGDPRPGGSRCACDLALARFHRDAYGDD